MTKDLQKIPTGWKKVKLGEVCKVKGGYAFKSTDFIDYGIPLIKITNINGNKVLIENADTYIESSKINLFKEFIVQEGDILIALSGATVGKIGKVFTNVIGLLNQRVGTFLPDYLELSKDFLFYLLNQNNFLMYILNNSPSSAQPNISPQFIGDFEVILPPLLEQEKIAEILETVDNAIEKTDKFIEKYKRMKQGLMQELLTKGIDSNWQIRSEKTHKFKDSPLGRIPADWEVKNISEVIENLLNGTWGDEKDISDNCYPIIRSTEIDRYGRINLESADVRKVDKKLLDRFALKNFDILIVASSGSQDLIGRVALFKTNLDNNKFLFSNFMLRVRTTGTLKPIFLYYFLNSDRYKNFIQTFQETTTGLRNFPKKDFLKLTVSLPPLLEQERIASALSQVDAVIEKETAYRDKLSRIKQGLMEDLLTGKVRVTALLKNNQYQKEVL